MRGDLIGWSALASEPCVHTVVINCDLLQIAAAVAAPPGTNDLVQCAGATNFRKYFEAWLNAAVSRDVKGSRRLYFCSFSCSLVAGGIQCDFRTDSSVAARCFESYTLPNEGWIVSVHHIIFNEWLSDAWRHLYRYLPELCRSSGSNQRSN